MWTSLIWLIFFLIIVLIFKNHIKRLFEAFIDPGNKAQKLKHKDFSLDLGRNTDVLLNTQEEYASAKQREYLKAFQSHSVTQEENLIRRQLIEVKMRPDQAIDVLIHHLANQNLLIKLLYLDRLIFKEQIKLLKYLNSQIKPKTKSELLNFYQEWLNSGGDESYSFDNFLNFLSSQNLIISGIDGYSISVIGKEYLNFLIRIGRDF